MRRKGLIERNTFVRGLVTEASPLTFPENASIVEENFTLNRDGSRSRRLGIDFEASYTANEDITAGGVTTDKINTYEWFNAGNTQNKNFIVVQIGNTLSFYDIEESDTLSANKRGFEVSLSDYSLSSTSVTNASEVLTSFSVIRGLLVVTNERTHPIYVAYDSNTDMFSVGIISIRTRDYVGVDDGFLIEDRPLVEVYGAWWDTWDGLVTLTFNRDSDILPHWYNLHNQGWSLRGIVRCHRGLVNDADTLSETDGLPVNNWNGASGWGGAADSEAWPSNSDIMHLGNVATATASEDVGKFFPYQMYKQNLGGRAAPRGSSIINTLDTIRYLNFSNPPTTPTITSELEKNLISLERSTISSMSWTSGVLLIGANGTIDSTGATTVSTPKANTPIRIKGVTVTANYKIGSSSSPVYSKELTTSLLGFLESDIIPAQVISTPALNAYAVRWDLSLLNDADKSFATTGYTPNLTFDFSKAQLYYYTDSNHDIIKRDTQEYSYTTTEAYAGRAWYSGLTSGDFQNHIFYSQVIRDHFDLGKCYSEGDPTSETNSDIVDTDGGYIVIPEADRIVNMTTMGRNLFVFATNGVWRISGGVDNFVATSNAVDKISGVGVESPHSVVAVENSILFWSSGGIYAVSPNDQGDYSLKNISETTVQTDFLAINKVARQHVKSVYDPTTKSVYWLVNESPDYEAGGGLENTDKFDTLYGYETVLGSFFKYKIATDTANLLPFIADMVQLPTTSEVAVDRNLYSNGVLVESNGVQVITGGTVLPRDTLVQTKVLVVSLNTGGTPFVTFAEFNNADFLDWYTHDSTGTDYTSRLVTGYELGGSLTQRKQAIFLHMFFNRTETAFEGTDPSIEAVGESSCLVYPLWDFATPPTDAEFAANSFQTYRIPRWYATGGATYDYGQEVIVSKSKLRGRGRALALDIRSETGKDCHIYGWGIPITRQERT